MASGAGTAVVLLALVTTAFAAWVYPTATACRYNASLAAFPTSGAACTTQFGPGSSIAFAVLGDFGRTGSYYSFNNGNPDCLASDYVGDDEYQGGAGQQLVAKLLNDTCGPANCSFVMQTGDNWYQCGADDMYRPGQGSRLAVDWQQVYQKGAYTGSRNLPWYNVIGNHDLPTNGSVDLQISYQRMSSLWKFPARYYYTDFFPLTNPRPAGPLIRYVALNTNPCVTKYAKLSSKGTYSNKYGRNREFNTTHTADYVNNMTAWFEDVLASSKARWTVVSSHYPLFSSSATKESYGNPAEPSGTYPGEYKCWEKIRKLIVKYNVVAYFNGHDHAQGIAFNDYDANSPTMYVTSGSASVWDNVDGNSAAAAPKTNVTVAYSSNTADGLYGGGGIAIVTADNSTFKVDMYNYYGGVPSGTPCTAGNPLNPRCVPGYCDPNTYSAQLNGCSPYRVQSPAFTPADGGVVSGGPSSLSKTPQYSCTSTGTSVTCQCLSNKGYAKCQTIARGV